MAGLELVVVAAVAEDRTIGDEGEMPWHHPEDLRHFRRLTLGAPVIMGRRTYEAIVDRLGHALDGRTNLVLSRREPAAVVDEDHVPDDETAVEVVSSRRSARERAAATAAEVAYVVGGQSVYEQFLPEADRLVITEVPGRYQGDARFPTIDPDVWELVDRDPLGDLEVATYRRRRDE